MAYETLKSIITQNIKTNGQESITGMVLQQILLQMVDELGYTPEGDLATKEWVNTQLSDYASKAWVTTQLGGYLPLTGGTITGNLGVNGYITINNNILHSGNMYGVGTEFYIGRNNNGVINTGKAHLRLGANNVAELHSGLPSNFFGFDDGGNFKCLLYDALLIRDVNNNNKNILGYSYDEYDGALWTDCDFISDGSVTAPSFIKSGGTSDQVLCADGSVKTLAELKAALNAI